LEWASMDWDNKKRMEEMNKRPLRKQEKKGIRK